MDRIPVVDGWTIKKYLAYEQETGIKHEYIDGRIYAGQTASRDHSIISTNTIGTIGVQIRDTECYLLGSDMRIKISDIKYLYPDLSVVCGKSILADPEETMLTNPILIVEVTSPQTRNFDIGRKAEIYRYLSSLHAYLTIDQTRVFIQLYTRQDNGWLLQEFDKLDQTIPLPMINAELPLSDVYRDINFDAES